MLFRHMRVIEEQIASAFRSAFSRERLVVVMDSFGIMAKIDKSGFNMYSIHVDAIRQDLGLIFFSHQSQL